MMDLTWAEVFVFLLFVAFVAAVWALTVANGPVLAAAMILGAVFAVFLAMAVYLKI
jgi:hypothetical protein